eukprot:3114952-Rhodomonas_salina.3
MSVPQSGGQHEAILWDPLATSHSENANDPPGSRVRRPNVVHCVLTCAGNQNLRSWDNPRDKPSQNKKPEWFER